MAAQIGSLYASLTMDVGQYASSWALADRITARGTSKIRKEAGLAQASIDRFSKSTSTGIRPYGLIAVSRAFERVNDRVGLLRGSLLATTAIFGGLTAALGSNLVLRYADSYTNLSNQIRVVSKDSIDLAGQLNAVSAAAENSRSSLSATAVLYARLSKAAPSRTNTDVLEFVQTIQKALALGGATAQEAASAAIQFSQAIASNRLGGEELRAVLETPLGLALAKGLGVTIGKLREMGFAGELTADRVLGALAKVKGEIDAQFSQSVRTIDQSLVQADNRLTEYIGTLDKTYGLTRLVSGGILSFANNIDTVAAVVGNLGLALGAVFGGRLLGRGAGRAVDATIGEIGRRSQQARTDVVKLTQAQSDLTKELNQSTRAFGNLQKRDNLEFAGAGDIKMIQREEEKLNKLRAARLATTERLKTAVAAAGAVEVKTSKQTLASATRIVETQDKIETSLGRQVSLTNELQKAETRLTAAKGKQTLNTTNIGAVKEAERDIIRIRQAQIVETTKASQLEQTLGNQRIDLANKIGVAESKAAVEKAKYQSVARNAAQESVKLQADEITQTQRLGRVRAAVAEVGAINKQGEVRASTAALDGLRTSLNTTAISLATAARNTSLVRNSFGLLKTGAASLAGFLGGPWGVAFTGAIALTTLFGIRSAAAAAEAENTRKALKDVLGEIAAAGGKLGDAAASSLRAEEIKGQLDVTEQNIELFRKGVDKESAKIEDALFKAFDPFINTKLANRSDTFEMFESASAGIKSLVSQVASGVLAFDDINRAITALPEAKFLDGDQIELLTQAVAEAGKFEQALRRVEPAAASLRDALSGDIGNLDVVAEINASAAAAAQAATDFEGKLSESQKAARSLLIDLKEITKETEIEGNVRKATAAIMKDNASLLEREAREIAIVNAVLEIINTNSDEWLRSTEATTGEFGRLLGIARQIAPELDFAKQALNSTQLAAINDMLAKQMQLAKTETQRTVIGERERAILEQQDSILESIRSKYGTIEGVNLDGVKRTAEALVDFDRGADAIARASEGIASLSGATANFGTVAAASVNQYVRSLNGAGSLLESFRSQQAAVLNQFLQVKQQTADVSTALSGYRGELQRLISTSSQKLFGGLENTAGVRAEIAAAGQAILVLSQRFFDGKISGIELVKKMAEIEARLKALGADTNALDPFIQNILTAIQKVAELLGIMGQLKVAQASLASGPAGTGMRTVDPNTGIGVTRFGNDTNDNSAVVRSVEEGIGVTRYGLESVEGATDRVGDDINSMSSDVGGRVSQVSDGIADVDRSIYLLGDRILSGLNAVTAAFGNGQSSSTNGMSTGGIISSNGGLGIGLDLGSDSNSYSSSTGKTYTSSIKEGISLPRWGYEPPSMDDDGVSSYSETSQQINVQVTVAPVMEGTRLSAQSYTEIQRAASEGVNAALREYSGR